MFLKSPIDQKHSLTWLQHFILLMLTHTVLKGLQAVPTYGNLNQNYWHASAQCLRPSKKFFCFFL